jgi:hypothetical protein
MTSLVRVALVVSIALGALLGMAACKSGQGERCQIKDDCESGLVCTNLGFCDTNSPDNTPDGSPPDARPPADGGIDGAIDASVDGAPDAT